MITGDELVNLMFTSMNDDKVIEAISELGMEQPLIDEQYERDLFLEADSMEYGIGFEFREIDGFTSDGEPCLTYIEFKNNKKFNLPFDLDIMDSYSECSKKLNSEAKFKSEWIDEVKVWVKEINNKMYTIAINYENDSFDKIDYLIISNFNEENINDTLIENKE